MKIYAELNNENICVAISQLLVKHSSSNLVEVGSFDESYLFKKYENGEWSEEKYKPVAPIEPYQPTNAEIAQMLSDLQADLIIAGVIE